MLWNIHRSLASDLPRPQTHVTPSGAPDPHVGKHRSISSNHLPTPSLETRLSGKRWSTGTLENTLCAATAPKNRPRRRPGHQIGFLHQTKKAEGCVVYNAHKRRPRRIDAISNWLDADPTGAGEGWAGIRLGEAVYCSPSMVLLKKVGHTARLVQHHRSRLDAKVNHWSNQNKL